MSAEIVAVRLETREALQPAAEDEAAHLSKLAFALDSVQNAVAQSAKLESEQTGARQELENARDAKHVMAVDRPRRYHPSCLTRPVVAGGLRPARRRG